MAAIPNPPRSPTLLPPRKSVELEDPGAHELSDNDDDHFSDAQEGRGSHSRPPSPIPITRVEKVDDRDSHGDVPGTDAYNKRLQDAVPDELEVIPEGVKRRSGTHDASGQLVSPGGKPVPRTVVEKIDPTTASHGDVPGTPSHSKRQADAVPDEIRPISDGSEESHPQDAGDSHPQDILVPMTVVTKVDSEPSHGEVPGTDAFETRRGDAKPDVVEKQGDIAGLPIRSRPARPQRTKSLVSTTSPIAADGGFGIMESDESEHEGPDEAEDEIEYGTEARDIDSLDPVQNGRGTAGDVGHEGEREAEWGDDFDDFEAGGIDEDFGDFDEGDPSSPTLSDHTDPLVPSAQPLPPLTSLFPILDFSELDELDDIITATGAYLDEMFPTTKDEYAAATPSPAGSHSIFLSDRSLSLWSQLVAPPPLQPPNWVRSRIRRLFLVSLGVPVDLDEILPASKQKKLVLPSTRRRSGSHSPPESRNRSRVRLKQDNESTTSVDKTSTSKASRKRKGPAAAPELDVQAMRMLCTTTKAAISNMTDDELEAHTKKLEDLAIRVNQGLEYWLKRRDSALGEKEAFEGVIENLVKHARRVRK